MKFRKATKRDTDDSETPVQDEQKKDEKPKKVPISNYWRILSFGTRADHAFLMVGLGSALAAGVPLPLMNIIFGQLAGDFNNYFIPGSGVTERVFKNSISQNSLYIVYLFIGKFILSYISSVCPILMQTHSCKTLTIFQFCFRTVGLRISAALRLSYMQALLAQPITKLDHVSTGRVSNTITTSSNTIQASVSDQLSRGFEGIALMISAYAIAFSYSW